MTKKLLLAAVLIFSLTACTGETSALQKFESKDAGFSILLPGQPTEQTKSVDSAIGQLNLINFELNKGDTYYIISTTDYPASVFESATLDQLLDSARDGAVSNAQGTLIKEEKILVDKFPGRLLEVGLAGSQTIRAKFILAEKRLYQIVIVGPTAKMNNAEINETLSSFALLKDL